MEHSVMGRRALFRTLAGTCAALGITQIEKASAQPGDVMVLKIPKSNCISQHNLNQLREQMGQAFPGCKVLVMDEDWKLEIVKGQPWKEMENGHA